MVGIKTVRSGPTVRYLACKNILIFKIDLLVSNFQNSALVIP